jgi:translation initiation factor 2 beta subunit (eIF-2beta)/eIF-5
VQNILYSNLPSKNINIKINTYIILYVVLYGCETWSLTLREERRLRVLENRVMRKIFGLKTEEETGVEKTI